MDDRLPPGGATPVTERRRPGRSFDGKRSEERLTSFLSSSTLFWFWAGGALTDSTLGGSPIRFVFTCIGLNISLVEMGIIGLTALTTPRRVGPCFRKLMRLKSAPSLV